MVKILLIKRGALGDLLMATPLIRQLKQLTGGELDIIVGASAAPAIKANPYLNQQIILPDKYFTLSGILQLSQVLWRLRSKYNYIFLLDKHWYFNLLAIICGARRIGYWRKSWEDGLLNHGVHYYDVTRYHALYYLDLLAASGLAIPDYQDIALDLVITAGEQDQVDLLMKTSGLITMNFVVLVNSGGNNSYESSGIRMLPADKVVNLLHHILNKGYKVVLLGGALDLANYAAYIATINEAANIFNWAGKLSLGQSAYLLSQAYKFYTSDCGAMHLGVAVLPATRMIAFFGPSNPAHILPPLYVELSALWSDQDIYHADYQLRGVLRKLEPNYFSKLNISALL